MISSTHRLVTQPFGSRHNKSHGVSSFDTTSKAPKDAEQGQEILRLDLSPGILNLSTFNQSLLDGIDNHSNTRVKCNTNPLIIEQVDYSSTVG